MANFPTDHSKLQMESSTARIELKKNSRIGNIIHKRRMRNNPTTYAVMQETERNRSRLKRQGKNMIPELNQIERKDEKRHFDTSNSEHAADSYCQATEDEDIVVQDVLDAFQQEIEGCTSQEPFYVGKLKSEFSS